MIKIKMPSLLILTMLLSSVVFGDELTGKITDISTGSALSGAVIWLENTAFADTTDANGNFYIDGIPVGEYDVIIQANNYQQKAYGNFRVDNSTAIGDNNPVNIQPQEFRLMQNYPNPFNPQTTIAFELPKSVHVQVRIFDVQGRQLTLLADNWFGAGHHKMKWDGTDMNGAKMASGMYYYQIQAGKFTSTRKMILIQ